jgi:hypothetical protein
MAGQAGFITITQLLSKGLAPAIIQRKHYKKGDELISI